MASAQEETAKRLKLADEFTQNIKDSTLGVIMVGSVAYAANENVSEKSDLDLVVVYNNVKECIPLYFLNKSEQAHLYDTDYDGYLAKKDMEGVPVSIHNISYKTLEKVANAEYEYLSYYRQTAKDIAYRNKDFDGVTHEYYIQSIPVYRQLGVKRLDPIAFEDDGKFVIGNDMDKFLSAGTILHDTDGLIDDCIETLWHNVALRMIEHYKKQNKPLNICQADISKSLCRSERFSCVTQDNIKQRTQRALRTLKL